MKKVILYSMEDFPVSQNRVYANAKEAKECPRGDIRLQQDSMSGVVYNGSFMPNHIVYDEHYQNEQGYSLVFQEHLNHVVQIVSRYFKEKSILEIGCGKGTFLELLRSKGFYVVGTDPAYEGNSDYIIKQHFKASLGISGDAIILRHVLEHMPDPIDFLISIREANGGKGLVYIEVPCFDWICHHRAWFDIYYEHVNYFRLSDFSRFFANIFESGRLFGGQYLYVVADLASLSRKYSGNIHEFRLPKDFLAGVDRAVSYMKRSNKIKNAIWGGASKGVIFALLLLRRGGVMPDLVIDINPAKQGKYFPVTALPILSPRDGLAQLNSGDTIFVMNSNYFDEIKSLAGEGMTYYKVDQNDF